MAIDKTGIAYYSEDSDSVEHPKIKLIFNEFNSHGPWIWDCLKSVIYRRKGYYFDLNNVDELSLFASDVCKQPVSLVVEVIRACVRRELFDKRVFDVHNVLTSERIQNNYLRGTREKRNKDSEIKLIEAYWLVKIKPAEKSIVFSTENYGFSMEKVNISLENGDKEEKIKEDKRRGEGGISPAPDIVFIFFKEKSGWPEEKSKKETKKFLNYYGKTGWLTKNGPITNWENAAAGWIEKDSQFESAAASAKSRSGKNGAKPFPDYWDKQLEQSLDIEQLQLYWKHLKSLGFVRRFDSKNNPIGYFKE